MSFWYLRFHQKNNEFSLRISALATKMWLNQKRIKTLYFLWLFKNYLIGNLFWFNLFLEARAEILTKNVGRNENTKRTFRNYLTFRMHKSTIAQMSKFCPEIMGSFFSFKISEILLQFARESFIGSQNGKILYLSKVYCIWVKFIVFFTT